MTVLKRIVPCSWWLLCIASILCLGFPGTGTADQTKNDNPWDKAFLTAPAAELLSAASAVPASEKDGAIILLDEGTFSFDALGRCISRYRLAYRILTRAGVEEWSSLSADWAPWHEERPVLSARVVTPDGVEHILSQETISDSPARENSPNIYSDRRKVRAPLPALTVGAVVEQEIVIREKEPFFAAGSVHRFFFGRSVRVLRTRVVLESPTGLPVRHVARILPQVSTTRREGDGRTRLTIEAGPMEPLEPVEAGMPGDIPRWPNVAFTAGSTWSDVTARYGEIVDRRIATADLSALVRETVGDATGRDRIAARLLERLRRDVRYTGIEFGSSSIIPRPPEETLRHKYGDCKDQAALLIKMLRTAGVPAYMALLRSRAGEDVDQDLPGLGDFDHAIVYVPGTPALWIDPTDSFRPTGELPLYDQGRRALIAGGPFSSLTVTPETPSSGNRQLETREFFLAEQGKAKVIETTLAWGSFGAAYRKDYSESDPKAIREGLGEYARTTYLADHVSAAENSNPNDMGTPFRIRLEMNEASRGFTDEDEAVVVLSASFLTERLPSQLTDADKSPAAKRNRDYLIPEPYLYEVRYRIVPPPGFKARPLPESGTTRLGPMALSSEFRLQEDGAVAVVLRFDTVKRRLSPGEFMAVKDPLQTLKSEKPIFVRFEQTGRSLLAAGRFREALEQFRRLSSLHPGEALHHVQIAKALLDSGLGDAARKEAERAVSVEPNSPMAHRTLAWVLQHDAVGRLRRKGFDRNRAITEYRKAKALDPADFFARGDLAILLEFNADGEHYGRNADLAGAIDEFRAIRADLKRTELDDNLLACLYRSERWKELKELALSLGASETRTLYLLLAIAGEEGASAALKEAYRQIPDPANRRKTLETLATSLVQVRHYRDAADLLHGAANGASNTVELRARINLLKGMQHHDGVSLPEGIPQNVVKRMFLSLFVPESAPDSFFSLFARPVREEIEKKSSGPEIRAVMDYFTAKARKEAKEVPREVLADFVLSNLEFLVDGNDVKGYRIDASAPPSTGGNRLRLYVIKEEGKYRIVTSNVTPNIIGVEVLRRAKSGDLDGARTWLDWAREESSPERDDDPLSEEPFARIWTKGSTADQGRIRLAAACLLSGMRHSQVIPILLKERETAAGALRTTIDTALARAYMAEERYPELLKLCDRLDKAHPLSPFLFTQRAQALRSMNRLDKAISLAQERLVDIPRDPTAMRVLAYCSERLGKLEQAEAFYKKLVEAGTAGAGDYNNLAWLGLFRTPATDESLAFAERAVALTGEKNAASLNTLSALYAEMGKTAEARETLLKTMGVSDMNGPASGDWYVLGRIAEQYGENEAAVEAYGKVAKPAPEQAAADSSYTLARKRLLKLTGKAGDSRNITLGSFER